MQVITARADATQAEQPLESALVDVRAPADLVAPQRNPSDWMPWNYRETLAMVAKRDLPESTLAFALSQAGGAAEKRQGATGLLRR